MATPVNVLRGPLLTFTAIILLLAVLISASSMTVSAIRTCIEQGTGGISSNDNVFRSPQQLASKLASKIINYALENTRKDSNYVAFLLLPPSLGGNIANAISNSTNTLRTGGWIPVKVNLTLERENSSVKFELVMLNPYIDSVNGWRLFDDSYKYLRNRTVLTLTDVNENSTSTEVTLRDLNLYYAFAAVPVLNTENPYTNEFPVVTIQYSVEPYPDRSPKPVTIIVNGEEKTLESKYASELLSDYTGKNLWPYVNSLLETLVDKLVNSISNSPVTSHGISFSISYSSFGITPQEVKISTNKYVSKIVISGSFSWDATCTITYGKSGITSTLRYGGSGSASETIPGQDASDNVHGVYGGYTFNYLREITATYLEDNVIKPYNLNSVRTVKDGPLVNGAPTQYSFVPYVRGLEGLLEGQDLGNGNVARALYVNVSTNGNWTTENGAYYVRGELKPNEPVKAYAAGLLVANIYHGLNNFFNVFMNTKERTEVKTIYTGSWSASDADSTSWTVTYGNETYVNRETCYLNAKISVNVKATLVDVKSYLAYRQLLEPHLTFKVGMAKADLSKLRNEVSQNPSVISLSGKKTEGIDVVPALAPLTGYGIPTKVGSVIDQLGGNNPTAVNVKNALNSLSNTYSSYLGAVLPTYMPIPMPSKYGLNTFAPGEYVGFYAVTPEMKFSDYVNLVPGVPVLTFFVEDVKATYDGAKGIIQIKNHKLEVNLSVNEIDLMTLGIGVGTIGGKVVGSRLYIVPSYSSQTNENTVPNQIAQKVNGAIGAILSGVSNTMQTLLKFLGEKSQFLSDLQKASSELEDYGSYVQILTYLNSEKKAPPVSVFITTRTTARFIAEKSGTIRVSSQMYVLHLKILKVPILPIPIPIPLVFSSSSQGSAEVHVSKITVVPLIIAYDKLDYSKGEWKTPSSLDDLFYKAAGKGVYIYAVPVWSDTGEPVLMRGRYGNSSLVVEAVTNKHLSLSEVTDFGLPLAPIKINYSFLVGARRITLMPSWRIGTTLTLNTVYGIPIYVDIIRPKVFVLSNNGKYVTLYISRFLGRAPSIGGTSLDNYVDDSSNAVTGINDQLLSIKTVEAVELNTLASKIEPNESLNDVIINIGNKFLNLVEGIVLNMAVSLGEDALKNIIAVLLDPTGGLVSSYIMNLVDDILNSNLKNELSNAKESAVQFVKWGIMYVLEWCVREAAAVFIKNYLANAIYNFTDQVYSNIKNTLGDNVTSTIMYNANVMFLSKYALKTRPSLINTAYAIDVKTGEVTKLEARVLGVTTGVLPPYAKVELSNKLMQDGVVLVVKPASLVTTTAEAILGMFNIHENLPDVVIDVGNVLKYVAGWAKWVSSLMDSQEKEELMGIAGKLTTMADKYDSALAKLDNYMFIDGLNATRVVLPTLVYIPPALLTGSH